MEVLTHDGLAHPVLPEADFGGEPLFPKAGEGELHGQVFGHEAPYHSPGGVHGLTARIGLQGTQLRYIIIRL